MEVTNEFVQFFINKAQNEIGELNKTKVYLSAQVEYLEQQLVTVREEIVNLKKKYEDELAELKKDVFNKLEIGETANNIVEPIDLNNLEGIDQIYQIS